jgi:hypothetical protein
MLECPTNYFPANKRIGGSAVRFFNNDANIVGELYVFELVSFEFLILYYFIILCSSTRLFAVLHRASWFI